jgi:diguanylate cyclase (GGDEF)-like protein
MKKKVRWLIIAAILFVIISIVGFIISVFKDKSRLTVNEKNWIIENANTVINVNVLNDANVFGKDGEGIFYSFVKDFESEYGIKINPIVYTGYEAKAGITFGMKRTVSDSDIVLYKDHYVLVSKNDNIVNTIDELKDANIAISQQDAAHVKKYLPNINLSEQEIDNLRSVLENGEYAIVPLYYYLDQIISNDYHVVFHFGDITTYYVLNVSDDTISNIMKKYYMKWNSFDKYFNEYSLKLFMTELELGESDVNAIHAKNYSYGFVSDSPIEVIRGGNYGGINAVILSRFSKFADADINYNKFKNVKALESAIKNEKVDLYFNKYNFNDNYNKTAKTENIHYAVLSSINDSTPYNSINSLIDKEVYVEANTKLEQYLKAINGLKIKTYENEKELIKLNKKDVIIVLDYETARVFVNKELSNYSLRLSGYANLSYNFNVRKNDAFYKLLYKYVEVLDPKETANEGVRNYLETVKANAIFSVITKYLVYIILIVIIILLLVIKRRSKITIAKKIKKDDKLKYIDQLTSLKNRNYLNECITLWNNNTIYSQAVIVLDLNSLQEINDIYGYNEGDKQIKACANALIKTQLDNSEIVRTDGNEFIIYLVGYNQKQVINYIRKLTKELDNLPYNYGGEFGYSMINDDLKTVEDALNEAVDAMKKQKREKNNEEEL